MTGRRAETAAVAVLLIVVAVLAYGVHRRTTATAVDEQALAAVVAPSSVVTPPEAIAPLALFIGDFTKGTDAGGLDDANWTAILLRNTAQTTRLRGAVVGEGSGYVVRRSAPTFVDQVRRFVTPVDRIVVISGSRNDVIAAPAEVLAAAQETFALVRRLAPAAALLAIGPTWGTVVPSPEILATRDAVRQAAMRAGAYFVDPIEQGWFATGEPGLIGPDNVHPTDLGNQRVADYLTPVFIEALTRTTRP